ncbi:MAG: hypothetical protein R6U04_08495 [Bacteroidales bacterium]
MSNKENHIDNRTRKLFQETEFEKPSVEFPKGVMEKLEKEKVYGKPQYENIWQIAIAVGLPALYFLYSYLTGKVGFINEMVVGIKSSSYFKFIDILSENLLHDISLSTPVLIGIISIVLLLTFDRVILKLLYSYN